MKHQHNVYYFIIKGKGVFGYLRNLHLLNKCIRQNDIDIIHAHYGLSGLLAVLQKKIPVVITFHGSDVNYSSNRLLSRIASGLSSHNIIVEKSFRQKLKLRKDYSVVPCGVDLDTFKYSGRTEARMHLKWDQSEKVILFSSAFDNRVKNYPLAKEVMDELQGVRLIELKGYNREEISCLMNAADALLVSSFYEGSPQVVKEALACNLPVVSTPVGDVPDLLKNVTNSYVTPYNYLVIAETLRHILQLQQRSDGRKSVLSLGNNEVSGKLIKIYQSVLSDRYA